MTVKIEPVKPTECVALTAISRQTFYDTFHEQNTKEDMELFLESSFKEDIIQAEMLEHETHFFFAKVNGEIAGYLKLSTAYVVGVGADAVEISRIYVLKEKLGSGVGKALLEFSISFASELGKKIIFLGVWEFNTRAIGFYERFGFKKFDEHIFMVGNDRQTDWLMKMELL